MLINCNIATFLTGSALIPLGLNWWQAIIGMSIIPIRQKPLHRLADGLLLMVAIVVGNMIATAAIVASSLAGAYYHSEPSFLLHDQKHMGIRTEVSPSLVGFPVYSRAVWGMWGSQFAIWNRIFLSVGMMPF